MLTETITSPQNPLIKRFRAVREGRERHIIFVEGLRAVEEALRAKLKIEAVLYTEQCLQTDAGLELRDRLNDYQGRAAFVPPKLMGTICETVTPQGIALLARQPYYEVEGILQKDLVVIADRLQDPGNVGTIVRTCAAIGAGGLLAIRGTADPFGAKAVRAAMGAAFRLPIATGIKWEELKAQIKCTGHKIVVTETHGNTIYTDFDWRQSVALVIGNEGEGIDDLIRQDADASLKIPMVRETESLNAAAATAVLLYEAARQGGFKHAFQIPPSGRISK